MSSSLAPDQFARPHLCETLEDRIALTTNALSDLPELLQFSGIDGSVGAHSISGTADPQLQIDYVRENYSFNGSGQTVAIIDSGIAWDHYALGGGYGQDFRVVGGWDFAENDANPFDDGPGGFHGTHVAGIVGSDDAQHEGVASGVDLVGLRVFDDRGGGKLEWVEQALQWVHDHRNDFEHPITTVNLSLGVNWNADTIPDWATLEDEFTQLKKDGIFISVAAGNSFQDYLTKGVSYPAASRSVVPVASHGDDGLLSDFSQRNNRVIVAPGENISSTIPAHIYGQSGPSNKFMSTSGTSMAAPYLAGASVLLREAFELSGKTSIDQDLLYKHFQNTADQVYDTFTNAWYSRLNLSAAINAALEDGHGDTRAQATDLGTLSSISNWNGVLAKADDVDFFRFVADTSGQVTFNIDGSHDLNWQFNVVGHETSVEGNRVVLNVKAGQEYLVRMNATSGQGNYQVDANLEASVKIEKNLGIIRSNLISDLKNVDEAFYQFTAGRSAILTVEALYSRAAGNLEFEIYDSNEQLVATSNSLSAGARADFLTQKGDTYTIKLVGNHDSFDLKLTNLVRTVGTRVIAGGTGQSDSHSYHATEESHQIVVNGTQYEFSKTDFAKVRINGGTGNDSLELVGTAEKETLTGGNGQAIVYGQKMDVIGRNFESIQMDGNGGDDLAVLSDSAGSDFFLGTSTRSELVGGGYRLAVEDFNRVTVISNGGNDRARLVGTVGDDFLHIHKEGTSLAGVGYQNYLIGFEEVDIAAGAGMDNVIARGTTSAERLLVSETTMTYENTQGRVMFGGFSQIVVSSGGGFDQAILNGLREEDSLARNGQQISGVVFGQELVLDDFQHVDWTAAGANSPSIHLSAVDEIFDAYAD